MLSRAYGQNNSTSDPYRNFVGHWSGIVKVNPTHIPPQIDLTITETPDGKKMIWDYICGTLGQEGYSHTIKTIILKPAKEQMTTHWKGDEDSEIFQTTGLAEFANAGYGQFSALNVSEPTGLIHSKNPTKNIATFELQASTMSYRWEIVKGGIPNTWSLTTFQRTDKPQ